MKSKLIQRGDCSKAQEDYYSYHNLFLNQEEEKKTRERNEEAMLQILENMSDTSSGADL